jgi:hypothetical protein
MSSRGNIALGGEAKMSFEGINRRVHTCFVTENCEYHTREGVCVAVRDRATSAWIAGHRAVGLAVDAVAPGTQFLGSPLTLVDRESTFKTSPVVDILRPNRNEVDAYLFVRGLIPA